MEFNINFKTFLVVCLSGLGLFLFTPDCYGQTPIENQLTKLFQKTDLQNSVIVITGLKNNKVEYTSQRAWKSGQDDIQRRGGDIVCQGRTGDFVECVQNYLVKGGKCLIYQYKNSDLYVAQILR